MFNSSNHIPHSNSPPYNSNKSKTKIEQKEAKLNSKNRRKSSSASIEQEKHAMSMSISPDDKNHFGYSNNTTVKGDADKKKLKFPKLKGDLDAKNEESKEKGGLFRQVDTFGMSNPNFMEGNNNS